MTTLAAHAEVDPSTGEDPTRQKMPTLTPYARETFGHANKFKAMRPYITHFAGREGSFHEVTNMAVYMMHKVCTAKANKLLLVHKSATYIASTTRDLHVTGFHLAQTTS